MVILLPVVTVDTIAAGAVVAVNVVLCLSIFTAR